MMRHAGMNNFTAIDIHTLTNRKSYGDVGNGFISGGGLGWNKTEAYHSSYLIKWHIMLSQKSDLEA